MDDLRNYLSDEEIAEAMAEEYDAVVAELRRMQRRENVIRPIVDDARAIAEWWQSDSNTLSTQDQRDEWRRLFPRLVANLESLDAHDRQHSRGE